LEAFVTESLKAADTLVALVRGLDATLLHSNEDCKDLMTSLSEAQKAWHDYQLHARR
jgi:hypothetical protein